MGSLLLHDFMSQGTCAGDGAHAFPRPRIAKLYTMLSPAREKNVELKVFPVQVGFSYPSYVLRMLIHVYMYTNKIKVLQ